MAYINMLHINWTKNQKCIKKVAFLHIWPKTSTRV
jgi:hypothetical protein